MQEYTLSALPHPPVNFFETGYTNVTSINERHQVAGHAAKEVARWDRGQLVLLPTPHDSSYGFDINDEGVIVGLHHLEYPPRAFVFRNGQMIDISEGLPGSDSAALAINNAGLIAGRSGEINEGYSPFLFDLATGVTTLLSPLPGDAYAIPWAVNESGLVAGISRSFEGGNDRIFLYRDGQMLDKGAARTLTSLNDSGVACGSKRFEDDHPPRAFKADLTTDEVEFIDLGHSRRPGSYWSVANDINNAGVVVGSSTSLAPATSMTAFVHYPDIGFVDLGPQVHGAEGWDLEEAVAISDTGVIIGNGWFEGLRNSFALYPIPVRSATDDLVLGFITIFGGVTAGGSGTGIIPGGPPIPIPAPTWHELHPAQRDLQLSAAIDNLATGLGDHRVAGPLREVARRLTREAAADLHARTPTTRTPGSGGSDRR